METLHRRCAGLDVHQKEIVACRRIVAGRKVRSELARFATTTQGLLALSAWLAEARITHVAMEATGVTGSRSGTCCDTTSAWLSPTPRTSATCRAARATPTTRPGSPTFSPRADPRQFRAASADPGPARPDPHAAPADARDRPSHPADPGDAGGGQHQAGLGHFRHPGLERPAHPEGDRVGPERPAAAGRTRPSAARLHARGTGRRVGRTLARPSSLPDRSASEDDRTDRSRDRGVRRAARGRARSLSRRRRAAEGCSRRQRQRRPEGSRGARRPRGASLFVVATGVAS